MYSKLAYIAKVSWKTLIVHYDWTEEETEDFFNKSLQSQSTINGNTYKLQLHFIEFEKVMETQLVM